MSNSIVDSYTKEDFELLFKIINEAIQHKDLSRILLNDSNKKWILKMENYIKSKSTIF